MSIYTKWIGRHVVVRTFSAGVHIGVLAEVEGQAVVLTNARRLWAWSGAFTLSEIAVTGIKPSESRLSTNVPEILLIQAIELIPTSAAARSSFDATHE
jgi:ferredoxin-fold anticodon binding domain-containing protein